MDDCLEHRVDRDGTEDAVDAGFHLMCIDILCSAGARDKSWICGATVHKMARLFFLVLSNLRNADGRDDGREETDMTQRVLATAGIVLPALVSNAADVASSFEFVNVLVVFQNAWCRCHVHEWRLHALLSAMETSKMQARVLAMGKVVMDWLCAHPSQRLGTTAIGLFLVDNEQDPDACITDARIKFVQQWVSQCQRLLGTLPASPVLADIVRDMWVDVSSGWRKIQTKREQLLELGFKCERFLLNSGAGAAQRKEGTLWAPFALQCFMASDLEEQRNSNRERSPKTWSSDDFLELYFRGNLAPTSGHHGSHFARYMMDRVDELMTLWTQWPTRVMPPSRSDWVTPAGAFVKSRDTLDALCERALEEVSGIGHGWLAPANWLLCQLAPVLSLESLRHLKNQMHDRPERPMVLLPHATAALESQFLRLPAT
jgi:hypothetical protein